MQADDQQSVSSGRIADGCGDAQALQQAELSLQGYAVGLDGVGKNVNDVFVGMCNVAELQRDETFALSSSTSVVGRS